MSISISLPVSVCDKNIVKQIISTDPAEAVSQ